MLMSVVSHGVSSKFKRTKEFNYVMKTKQRKRQKKFKWTLNAENTHAFKRKRDALFLLFLLRESKSFCFVFVLISTYLTDSRQKKTRISWPVPQPVKNQINHYLDKSGELSTVKMGGLARGERIPSYHTINLLTYTSSSCNMRFIFLVILFSIIFTRATHSWK